VLSDQVLQKARVFITPGGIFGEAGEKYIRISLCSPVATIEKAISRIAAI
ncbi:MAG: aminotransferase, partial [Chitinophagaceae bacterium]|nr:aminotransferase [Chitinophagaceae bacterium]